MNAAFGESSTENPADDRQLRIYLLGRFQVWIDGRVVEDRAWQRRKAASLVKLLALFPRHRLHREAILEYLWPEQHPEASSRNLRVVLHAARRALQPDGEASRSWLQIIDDEIALHPDGDVWTDVDAFERAAEAARRRTGVDAYRGALDLYAGDLLPADRYEDWVAGRRERLRETRLALMFDYAQALAETDDLALSIDTLERLVDLDPTHEAASARLMALYDQAGQRVRALKLFRQLRDALDRDLDAMPDEAVNKLYAEILANREPQPVPEIVDEPPAGSGRRSNLRSALTSFIGREAQVGETLEALQAARLVTLSGPGGAGKTRLALTVAETVLARHQEEVWWVDLASLNAAETIPQEIAAALDLRLDGTRDDADALVEALQGCSLLLVLDNCEHLVDGVAASVSRLLSACLGVRILVTSREPLRVAGEVVRRVPALGLPGGQIQSIEEVETSEAVQLFRDRARYLQPDFEVEAANAALITAICRQLDGLPLAIELAAARVSVLSLEQLTERLSDPLAVLASGSRISDRLHISANLGVAALSSGVQRGTSAAGPRAAGHRRAGGGAGARALIP